VNELNELKVKVLLAKIMRVDVSTITANSSTNTVATWDSLNHMKLVLALEEEFDVAFDETQIEQMSEFVNIVALIGQLKA